jgi:signal transduction histidine kinase
VDDFTGTPRRLSSIDELRAACARLVVASDTERRWIENALHDGVQQDLIALSVRLQLVRQLSGTDLPAAIDVLDESRRELQATLDRVRALANEIYPSILEARGLHDAIRAAASAAELVATVESSESSRYPASVEAALYFCFRAVLQVLASQPEGHRRVKIRIYETENAVELVADSEAAPDLETSAQLLGPSRDRIDALGGVLVVQESEDHGTRFTVTVPVL